jgi:creatinine amidohydrolase
MRVTETNWMQIEEYLTRDDRAVIPLGSTEQHAYLSLGTDAILAERVAVEAAEPLGVPVFPVLAYGVTPYFLAFPGSVSLRISTYLAVVGDILDSLYGQGFRRFLLVNGHGGNSPAGSFAPEWMAGHPGSMVVFHNWWNAPATFAAVQAIDRHGSHGSWMENFPWTRVASVPDGVKESVDAAALRALGPHGVKELIGDGNYGGAYQKRDEQMLAMWRAGVEETRGLIDAL